jgi:hypothetical protein
MILRSRKWRLLIRTMVLLLAGVLMLVFAAPASYALQDDTPQLITPSTDLHNEMRPLAETFVYTSDLPDLARIVTTKGIATTYHWIPVPGYGGRLFVRAEGDSFLHAYYRAMDLNMATGPRPANFYGKITPVKSQADAQEAIDALAARGIEVDKETAMVILQGEMPRSFRPMVPVWGMLALFWLFALVGLLRILSGQTQRRQGRYSHS